MIIYQMNENVLVQNDLNNELIDWFQIRNIQLNYSNLNWKLIRILVISIIHFLKKSSFYMNIDKIYEYWLKILTKYISYKYFS